jgi:acyl carrier protein
MDLMGLDFVELVMRTEEVFSVELPDDQCESIRTVGDLYRLVLEKLALPYISSVEIAANSVGVVRPLNKVQLLISWTTPDAWLTLRFLIHEELGIESNRITEGATFLDDLGCD